MSDYIGRGAAVRYWLYYRQDYYSVRSGNYVSADIVATDCANFVSQGLSYGGMRQSDEWKREFSYPDPYESGEDRIRTLGSGTTSTWKGANQLFHYIADGGESENMILQIGDLVFYDKDSDEWYDHVAGIVGFNDEVPLVVEHGLDDNETWRKWARTPDKTDEDSDLCNWERLLEEILADPNQKHIGTIRTYDSYEPLTLGIIAFVHIPDENE
jgi:hypothetical protein